MRSKPPRNIKLSEPEVVRIRAMRTAGEKYEYIHTYFPKVCMNAVQSAGSYRTWPDVAWWREWTDIYGMAERWNLSCPEPIIKWLWNGVSSGRNY